VGGMPEYRLSDTKIRHTRAEGLNDSGKISSQRPRHRQRFDLSLPLFPIQGINSCRMNLNKNFIRPRFRPVYVFNANRVRSTEGMDACGCNRPFFIQCCSHKIFSPLGFLIGILEVVFSGTTADIIRMNAMMSDVAKLTAPDTRTTSFMLTLEASSVPAARTDEMHGYPSELGASGAPDGTFGARDGTKSTSLASATCAVRRARDASQVRSASRAFSTW